MYSPSIIVIAVADCHRSVSVISIESRPVKFNSCNNEVYNSLFSIDEICDAIFKSHDTATGPDDIHY